MTQLVAFVHTTAFHHFLMGALGGALAAAKTDYEAFTHWNSFKDALTYSWGLALFRWIKGSVIGGVSAAAAGTVLS